MMPPNMDRAEFAERKRIGAEYLSRIARATSEERQGLIVDWAEKLYNENAQLRTPLVKSFGDIDLLLIELRLYHSGTVMPLLAAAHLDDSECEAIRLALAGRESEWLANIVLRFPVESNTEENSVLSADGEPVRSEDPIATQRRARVDEYIDKGFRVTGKHLDRSDIWKTAGHKDATGFERWQRNDPRSSKTHDRLFTRILTEKPHLK